MSNTTPVSEDLGEALRETIATSRTFYKAYKVGLTLAQVSLPNIKYRIALEHIKIHNAVTVNQVDAENGFTIAKVKSY
jgi:hypothetical protein